MDDQINQIPTNQQTIAMHCLLKDKRKIDTLEARRRGINHPAGRVKDLRNLKVPIETQWTETVDQKGKTRRVAFYVLQPENHRSILKLIPKCKGRK